MLRVGLQKTSLVDYPGKMASTVFLPGCNLRCPWCHNRDLVLRREAELELLVPIEDVLAHLEKRKNVIQAVVLSGGEPLLNNKLPWIVRSIKGIGLRVKIDTNGTFPDALGAILADASTRPDYIAMDVKLAPARYGELGGEGVEEAVRRSAALIRESGIEHEFRSLALPDGRLSGEDLREMAALVGDSPWYFAPFRGGNCLDDEWNHLPPADQETLDWALALARSHGCNAHSRQDTAVAPSAARPTV